MNLDTQAQMQRAYTLIKDKRYAEARDILMPITRNEPQNADAWWLLANAQTDPNAARDALNILLRLNPNDERGRQRLDQLNQQFPPVTRSTFEDVPGAFVDNPASPLRDFASPGPSAYGAPLGFTPPVAVQARPQNTVLKVLLIACGVLVVACLACVGFGYYSIQRVISDPTLAAGLGTAFGILNLPAQLPAEANSGGTLSLDEPKAGNSTTGESTVYKLTLNQGDKVVIAVNVPQTRNNAVLYGIYDPQGKKVAGFDFSGIFSLAATRGSTPQSSSNPLAVRYTATQGGQYSILVVGLSNTSYTVTVSRGQ